MSVCTLDSTTDGVARCARGILGVRAPLIGGEAQRREIAGGHRLHLEERPSRTIAAITSGIALTPVQRFGKWQIAHYAALSCLESVGWVGIGVGSKSAGTIFANAATVLIRESAPEQKFLTVLSFWPDKVAASLDPMALANARALSAMDRMSECMG